MKQIFSILIALATLVAFLLLGRQLSAAIGWAVPGAVVGMLLLVATLVVLGHVPKGLALVADKALPHLALLFIPPVLAISQVNTLTLSHWVWVVLWLLVSWVVSLFVVAKLLNRGKP
jgi:holin-like protein